LKKLLLATTAAVLMSSPAFAWHPITITADTDPDEILSVFFTTPNRAAQSFPINMPGLAGWWRTFGPLHEDGGPCLRKVHVVVSNLNLGQATEKSATLMNVCTETWIHVSGTWPSYWLVPGATPLVVTHG
jgi:hypothetical protein